MAEHRTLPKPFYTGALSSTQDFLLPPSTYHLLFPEWGMLSPLLTLQPICAKYQWDLVLSMVGREMVVRGEALRGTSGTSEW